MINLKHYFNPVSSEGSLIYSEVTAFMKKTHTVTSTYMLITTVLNSTLSLTGEHLLHTRKRFTDKFNIM